MKVGVIGIFLVASVAAVAGFISGALMASSKVDQLYSRLDHAELALSRQTEVMRDLGKAMILLLAELDGKLLGESNDAVKVARAALSRI